MARRPIAGNFLRDSTPIFNPVARPVDTFVQPGRPAESGAEALLSALSGLDRSIRPQFQKAQDKTAKKDFSEAQALFLKTRKEFGQAVRDGDIPAGASPYFRKGYRTSQLHAAGANYAVSLGRALEESQIYKIDDAAQIEQFLTDFHSNYIDTNSLNNFDPVEMAQTFSPMVQQAHDGFRLKQANRNIEFIETERMLAFEGEVLATFAMQTFDGSTSQINAAVSNTAAWVKAKADELDVEGIDRRVISKTVIDIITSAAEADNDTDILKVLDSVKLGTGPLSGTQYGRQQQDRARERILSSLHRASAAADRANRKAREAAIDTIQIDLAGRIIEGDIAGAEALLPTLAGLDGAAAIAAWKNVNTLGGVVDDELERENFGEVRASVLGASTAAEANEAINYAVTTHAISGSTGDDLRGEYRRIQDNPEWGKYRNSATVNRYRSGMSSIIEERNRFGFVTPRSKAAVVKAWVAYEERVFSFYNKHEQNPPPELELKFLGSLASALGEQFRPGSGISDIVVDGEDGSGGREPPPEDAATELDALLKQQKAVESGAQLFTVDDVP